jgi:hypothetical protein
MFWYAAILFWPSLGLEVPLDITTSGDPAVLLNVLSDGITETREQLLPLRATSLTALFHSRNDVQRRQIMVAQIGTLNFPLQATIRSGPQSRFSLGIGPDSDLETQSAGGIGVVHRGTDRVLLLDTSAETFSSADCQLESVLTVPTVYMYALDRQIYTSNRLMWNGVEIVPQSVVVGTDLSCDSCDLMEIPNETFNGIVQFIEHQTGAVLRNNSFSNCSQELVSRSPVLITSFFPNAVESTSRIGTIILTGEDYLLFNETARSCSLRVSPRQSDFSSISILRLPEINIHITEHYIRFCDPL